jgi:T6SS, Phospholipase effector Tle1-like, catalytic domain
VVFDLFGFSRGAALARHFVNLIHAWPEIWPPVAKANIEFVGLFDTVGSFYVPGNSENFDFNLHLHSQSANHVVHLTAFHEIRKNFPLTSIRSAQGLPVNFTEKAMPGVHSDVGGGYENPEVDFRNYETFFIRAYQGHGLNSETIRAAQEKISELNRADPRNIQPRVQGTDVFAEERRATRKELAIYALHQMHRYAQESGVPLAPMRESQPEFLIPNELQKKLDKWLAAGGKLSEARDYLEGYIHTSHREWTLAHHPESSQQRRVFLIKPEKAVKAEAVHA